METNVKVSIKELLTIYRTLVRAVVDNRVLETWTGTDPWTRLWGHSRTQSTLFQLQTVKGTYKKAQECKVCTLSA